MLNDNQREGGTWLKHVTSGLEAPFGQSGTCWAERVETQGEDRCDDQELEVRKVFGFDHSLSNRDTANFPSLLCNGNMT